MDLLSGQEAQKQKVPPVAWQIRRTQNFDIVALFSCSTVFGFGKTEERMQLRWFGLLNRNSTFLSTLATVEHVGQIRCCIFQQHPDSRNHPGGRESDKELC